MNTRDIREAFGRAGFATEELDRFVTVLNRFNEDLQFSIQLTYALLGALAKEDLDSAMRMNGWFTSYVRKSHDPTALAPTLEHDLWQRMMREGPVNKGPLGDAYILLVGQNAVAESFNTLRAQCN